MLRALLSGSQNLTVTVRIRAQIWTEILSHCHRAKSCPTAGAARYFKHFPMHTPTSHPRACPSDNTGFSMTISWFPQGWTVEVPLTLR